VSAWFRGEATVARDAGGGQPVGYRPIEVDVSSLAKLARTLRDEVALNYHPQAQRVIDTIDPGTAALPPRPGIQEWEAARGQYEDGRNRAIDLLDAYERATLQIADAADFIAQRYRDSDAYARATIADVRDAFDQAARKYGVSDA
jgi:hypothetical protein